MHSPARLLLSPGMLDSTLEKVSKIYEQAAWLAFQLWTQRTTVRCTSLNGLKNQDLEFDITNIRLEPHSLLLAR